MAHVALARAQYSRGPTALQRAVFVALCAEHGLGAEASLLYIRGPGGERPEPLNIG
jgi:hypothetical protein